MRTRIPRQIAQAFMELMGFEPEIVAYAGRLVQVLTPEAEATRREYALLREMAEHEQLVKENKILEDMAFYEVRRKIRTS